MLYSYVVALPPLSRSLRLSGYIVCKRIFLLDDIKLRIKKLRMKELNNCFSFRTVGILTTVVVFLFIACGKQGVDIKIDDNGLEYGFYSEHKDSKKAEVGEALNLEMKYFDENDSLLFNSREISENLKLELTKPMHKGGSIEYALAKMHVGDSARFYVVADSFFHKTRKTEIPKTIKKGSKIRFEIKLLSLISKEEVEREHTEMLEKKQAEELSIIDDYVRNQNITTEPTVSGLYYLETKAGTGKKATPQSKVSVHYVGSFLTGEVFDSSVARKEPFEFVLGIGKVIAGWDEGISKMRQGGKAKLIIPSYLAYGEKGWGTLIPAFSTLIFDVELLKVE